MNEKLTDEQVKNWRRMLAGMFGPYALLMPVEQIQLFRDKMQADTNSLTQTTTEIEFCKCDTKKHGYTRHKNGVTCNKCQKPRKDATP